MRIRFRLKKPQRQVLVWFCVALAVDQMTKHGASLLGVVTVNRGISFGLFPSQLLTAILLLVFLAIYDASCRYWHQKFPVASGILLGSAMSNLVDRIVLGGVRDFLPVPIFQLRNNLADWGIILSLAWIAFKRKSANS